MDLNIAGQFQLGRALESFAQNIALDRELMLVAGVLVMASATVGEVWTGRLDAMRGTFEDRVGLRADKSRLLLDDRRFDLFPGKYEWNESGFCASACVGGKARKAIAAVNQFFNSEKQEPILNESVTGLVRRLHLRPMPIEN